MVIPQANTGNLKIKRKVVTMMVQIINARDSNLKFPFPFKIVVMKLNLATKLDTPAMWSLQILMSTDIPPCPSVDRGG